MTNALLSEMDATIFADMLNAGLGDAAVFYRSGDGIGIRCTVLVDKSVLYDDAATGAPSRGTIISAQRAELGDAQPELKSFFTIGRETFVVDRIIDTSDESRVMLLVTPSC